MTFYNYDTDALLYGDLADQKTLILNKPCTSEETELFFETVVGVSAPTFIRMEDELILVSQTKASSLMVTRDPSQAMPHVIGTAAYVVIAAQHLNILRDRAIEVQKCQGLVGNDADKPADPDIAEVYIALDTHKVYVCLTDGVWSLLGGATTHADVLREGESDDHLQYFTSDRLADWHNSLPGEHVTDGDNHDHSRGAGAGRVQIATSETLPGDKAVGSVRLATDTSELFIANTPGAWVAITGAPSGAVVMLTEADAASYGGACPPGWSRYVAMDGRFPKGAPSGISSPLNSGGVATHYHTYSQIPAHTHSIPAMNVTTPSDGSHSHNFPFSTLASGTGIASQTSATASDMRETSSGGAHTHTFTYPAFSTGSSGGSASANSSTASSLPPYAEVIFCKKD